MRIATNTASSGERNRDSKLLENMYSSPIYCATVNRRCARRDINISVERAAREGLQLLCFFLFSQELHTSKHMPSVARCRNIGAKTFQISTTPPYEHVRIAGRAHSRKLMYSTASAGGQAKYTDQISGDHHVQHVSTVGAQCEGTQSARHCCRLLQ